MREFFIVDLEGGKTWYYDNAEDCMHYASVKNDKCGGGIPRFLPYVFLQNQYCVCLYE